MKEAYDEQLVLLIMVGDTTSIASSSGFILTEQAQL